MKGCWKPRETPPWKVGCCRAHYFFVEVLVYRNKFIVGFRICRFLFFENPYYADIRTDTFTKNNQELCLLPKGNSSMLHKKNNLKSKYQDSSLNFIIHSLYDFEYIISLLLSFLNLEKQVILAYWHSVRCYYSKDDIQQVLLLDLFITMSIISINLWVKKYAQGVRRFAQMTPLERGKESGVRS